MRLGGFCMADDVRWIQRFQNYKKAFGLLKDIVESCEDICLLEPIVKEGIIQRFEYTYELAWKTLKDKMVDDGVMFEKISPKYVFKVAYSSNYVDSIEDWINMSNDRNLMSHTYDFSDFDLVLGRLQSIYFPLLEGLFSYFLKEELVS